MLLVAHDARLRQLVEALGEPLALQEIEAMTEPEEREPPRPASCLNQRWGGWARFFSSGAAIDEVLKFSQDKVAGAACLANKDRG